MIEFAKGNLLVADVEALVNTVNCVGHMGKGIALQFKQAFPENYDFYAKACRRKEVQPGRMLVFETNQFVGTKYIVNFPTKRHWRGNSRLADIEAGLADLKRRISELRIRSIAVPPLGCGHGGLEWKVVKPLIVQSLSSVPDVRVLLYEPEGAPPAGEMPVRTSAPNMTPARALFLVLMKRYSELDYPCSLLEMQKLAYFLQEAGEPLQLRYEAGHYGPYAPNLNKVLERIEGHFIRGYGDDQRPTTQIQLVHEAVEKAERLVTSKPESCERLQRVAELIEGYETPYGVELLASLHWVAKHEDQPARNADEALERVHAWNDRKRSLMRPEHVRVAWDHLAEHDWVGARR